MKICVGVPIMNQPEVTQKFLDTLRESETEKLPLYLVDNGSDPPLRNWLNGLRKGDEVIRNGANVGVVKALNQIWRVAKATGFDYIFYTHNDVMIYEKGWDAKILRVLSEQSHVGVAGFYGAKGIGTNDIYKSPYVMQQMIRIENVSGCHRMDAVIHQFRPPRAEVEDVAVMDGFSLIVSVELLNKLGGFDRRYPLHHMYDNDICLESLDKGYRNIVISMDADHIGGQTDVGEDWASPFGKTKQQVHEEVHPIFYEKWKPGKHTISLPVRVP
ncbi:MAG TPA: glycosyltransferase family 2 protein [bacterium]|nr:glycosyltransferase family 2 protein [bacterium]